MLTLCFRKPDTTGNLKFFAKIADGIRQFSYTNRNPSTSEKIHYVRYFTSLLIHKDRHCTPPLAAHRVVPVPVDDDDHLGWKDLLFKTLLYFI